MTINVYAIAFVIGTVVVITARILKNKRQAKQSQQVTHNLANNPEALEKLRSSLYHFYTNHTYPDDFNLAQHMSELEAGAIIDRYKINAIHRISDTEFVVVTTCTDKDFDVNFASFGDAKKVYNLNFRVALNEQKKLIEVFSNYFENNTTKALRARFGAKLFELVG